MKKIITLLVFALTLAGLVSCGGHSHDYTEKNTSEEYLAAEANCQSAASYYYSCSCGEAGTETFTSGDLGHSFVIADVAAKYRASNANCGSGARYYYSCSCGAAGTETFENGRPLSEHHTEGGKCTVCGLPESSAGLELELNHDGRGYTVVGIGSCTSTDIVIGSYNNLNVTAIGENAFKRCEAIESVTLNPALTSIGESAFERCSSLKSIVIPDGVEYIARGSFSYCSSLESVTIGLGVVGIKQSSFEGCSSLKTLVVPNSVSAIEDGTFYGCDSLESITLPCIEPHFGFIFGYRNGYSPFYHYQDLHGDYYTFYIPESLKSVTLSATVTEINYDAFFGCENISSITVSEDNPAYKSVDGNLYTKDGKTLIQYAPAKENKSFTVPDGVEKITHYAFRGCDYVEEVVISADVTYIGCYAFENCGNLKRVVLAQLEGWWYSGNPSATSGTAVLASELQDAEIAATYLKSAGNKVWKRN